MQYSISRIINTILRKGYVTMANLSYETHIVGNPLLPFRFHTLFPYTGCKRCSPNWHENIEILVCTRGSAWFMLDGRQYPFQPGDICIANAYCVHTTIQEQNLDYHCLIIDKNFCEENGIRTTDIFFREWIHDPDAHQAFAQVISAYEAYSPEDPYCVADIRYAVLGFLRILCRRHIVSCGAFHASVARERVKKAIEFIKTNYMRSISLQEIADFVGISKYHLSREFKEFTGSTVFDTLNMTRCAEAKRMIEGGASVTEAALSCGYDNLSYFTRAFKKHLGEKPSRFCKKQKLE